MKPILIARRLATALAHDARRRAVAPPTTRASPSPSVTPFAAGSGPDAVLRLVSDKLGRLWNQRVVVDNKPGGGGFIAIDAGPARRARRLHAAAARQRAHRRAAAPVQVAQLRDAAALRPGGLAVPHALLRRGADRFEVEEHERPDRRRQGQARRQLRLVGRRQPRPPGRAAARGADRHPDAARALPRGLAALRQRRLGRGAVELRQHPVEPGHLQGRQAALHRGRGAQAHAADARRADHGRSRRPGRAWR